jgi:hypothetical protein
MYLAFHLHFAGYADVDRMQEEIASAKTYGFSYLLDNYLINPGSAILLYVASFSSTPIPLLQCFAGATFFGSLIYVFFLMLERFELPTTAYLITCSTALFFFVFGDIVGGVRNFPAMAICTASILSITLGKNNKSSLPQIVCCIFAGLLHAGAWIILAIYLLTKTTNRKLLFTIYFLFATYGFFVIGAIAFAVKFLPGKQIWISISDKANGYFLGGSSYELFASKSKMLFMYYTLGFVFLLLLIFILMSRKKLSTKNKQYQAFPTLPPSYLRFIIGFVCFDIGTLLSGTPFRRYTVMLLFSSLPLIATTISGVFYNYHAQRASCELNRGFQMANSVTIKWTSKTLDSFQIATALYIVITLLLFSYSSWHLSSSTYFV